MRGRPEAQSWSPAGPSRSGGTWCHRSLAPVGVPAPPGRPRGPPARPLSRSAWTSCPSLGPSRPLPCAFAELLTRTPSPSPARPRRSPLPSRLGCFLSLSPADRLPTRARPLTAENVSVLLSHARPDTRGAPWAPGWRDRGRTCPLVSALSPGPQCLPPRGPVTVDGVNQDRPVLASSREGPPTSRAALCDGAREPRGGRVGGQELIYSVTP